MILLGDQQQDNPHDSYAYVTDENLFIGCSFCGDWYPCRGWEIVENI